VNASPILRIPIADDPDSVAQLKANADERVLPGQPLGSGTAEGHRPVAPCAGTLGAVEAVPLLAGGVVRSVVLMRDATIADEPWPADATDGPAQQAILNRVRGFRPTDLGATIDLLRNSGVWADRVTSPDLLAQLHQLLRRPADSVVCNVMDGDPNSCINTTLCALYPSHVMAGTMLLAQLSGAGQTWVVSESGSPAAWWTPTKKLVRELGMRFVQIPNRYPQSDPTLLLHTLFDRHLRPSRLPTDQGAIVIDAACALAIAHAVFDRRPMTHVPLALRDHAEMETHFLVAPVGQSIHDILSHVLHCDSSQVIVRCGDVLRDQRTLPAASIGGREITLHVTPRERTELSDPCIRCNWCADLCPTRVQPAALLEAAQRRETLHIERYGIDSCIECGICSYVCPSKLPLLEGIRTLKVMRLEEQQREN